MSLSRVAKGASGARTKSPPSDQVKPATESRQERQESEAEIAGYIAQLTAEMSSMAGAARLDLLAYFLSLARMEAETIARRPILDRFRA